MERRTPLMPDRPADAGSRSRDPGFRPRIRPAALKHFERGNPSDRPACIPAISRGTMLMALAVLIAVGAASLFG